MPAPVTRTSGLLRVALAELTDQHDRFTCLGRGRGEWLDITERTMTLYRDGQVVGTHAGAAGDFPMARQAATYRLAYDLDASAALPMSTKVSTAWTFRSSAPVGTASVPVPLLSVDYALPLEEQQTTGGVHGPAGPRHGHPEGHRFHGVDVNGRRHDVDAGDSAPGGPEPVRRRSSPQ